MSDVDEAVLAMWAQDEVPGAVKPVSSLYLGTVCNCGEKLECDFFFLTNNFFVQEVSSAATAAVAADEVAADEAEPTAGPSGLCGRRRAAQPSPDASFVDTVEEVCKNYFIHNFIVVCFN